MEAEVLSLILTMSQAPGLKDIPAYVMASPIRHQDRWSLLISSNLPEKKKLADIQAAIRKAMDSVPAIALLQARGALFAQRFQLPDFAALRKQAKDSQYAHLVEANWAMQCGYACIRLGVPLDRVEAQYHNLAPDRIGKLVTECCKPELCFSLRLTEK